MKEYLIELIRSASTPAQARNLTREYLQARILGALQRSGAMIPLAFHGGTALRFLYGTGRYSEDLDFALEKDKARYDFRAYLQTIKNDFMTEGYTLDVKVNDQRVVNSAFIRFPSLLNEMGLSPHADETFAVKLEVDTNPPAGAGLETTVIRRHVTLQLQHHDRASLLAGKLHAILNRTYLKGRDLYDLMWYLSDPNWPTPNLTLLNNALTQTNWSGMPLTESTWRGVIRERLQSVSWEQAVNDVRLFLEPTTNPDLLNRDNLLKLLA